MIRTEDIQNIMSAALLPMDGGDAVIVPTHCLFPGGQNVSISVKQGHGGGFTLTDEAQALAVVNEAGVELTPRQLHKASELAKHHTASFANGSFTLSGLTVEHLPAAIITLANLSQHWASELVCEHQIERHAELKAMVHHALSRIFPSKIIPDYEMLGQSNKRYSFDYCIPLSQDKFILVDTIGNHANAISSAFRRNYDVKNNANDNYRQEGVIENQPDWKIEDINILSEVLDGILPVESHLETLRKYA